MQTSDLYMPKSRTQFGETRRQGHAFQNVATLWNLETKL